MDRRCCRARPAAARGCRCRRSAGPRRSRTGPARRCPRCRRRGSGARTLPCRARRSGSRTRRPPRARGVPQVLHRRQPCAHSAPRCRGASHGVVLLPGHGRRRPGRRARPGRAAAEYTPRRSGRGRPAAGPGRDVPALVRRGVRGRAARAQRDGGGHRRRARGGPRRGWCCSRVSSERGFVFYTNPPPARASSWRPTRAARCSSPGTRWSARCGSTATPSRCRRRRCDAYFAVRPRGLPARRLGLAPVAGGRRPDELDRDVRRGAGPVRRRATCRRPRSGAATSCGRRPWSSGRAAPAGCTTGSSTVAWTVAGRTTRLAP